MLIKKEEIIKNGEKFYITVEENNNTTTFRAYDENDNPVSPKYSIDDYSKNEYNKHVEMSSIDRIIEIIKDNIE